MGVSTRLGTVQFLDDILADVGDVMHTVIHRNADKCRQVDNPERVADILGISAVMVQGYGGEANQR
jgi:arginyl-tRNA synthetase